MTVGALLKHVFQFNNLGVWMDYSLKPRDLAADARQLLATLNAPSRLIAHLALVHDAAAEILEAFSSAMASSDNRRRHRFVWSSYSRCWQNPSFR